MERALELIGGYLRLAWWDGCAVDLRLHRLADLIDYLAAAPETVPVTEPFRSAMGEPA